MAAFAGLSTSVAAEPKRIALPAPQMTGGKSLMEALSLRRTDRQFSNRAVDQQHLSNLLWATWGVNRPNGNRTAPTARNSQNVRLYVALRNGVWLYEAKSNELILAMDGDTTSKFGGAPVHLLYVAPAEDQFAGMHIGSLYQNAGLYCASVGLGNVVKQRGINALDGTLKLPQGHRVFIVQSIGWPK